MFRAFCFSVVLCCIFVPVVTAQSTVVQFVSFDGSIVGGYANKGGFLNFTGPGISLTRKHSKFLLGMLPSLRFKEDTGTIKNAAVMPMLGVGLTYSYRFLSLQFPVYYSAKTSTANGNWYAGVGIGVRINALKFRKNE